MQGFYEEYRDDNENFCVSRNGHYSYPPHFHRSLEILIVNKGAHSVVHNGVPYAVQNGDLFFCSSYDLHSYGVSACGEQDDCVLIVPARYTSSFNERNNGYRPSTPLLHDPALCRELLQIADRWKKTRGCAAPPPNWRLPLSKAACKWCPIKKRTKLSLSVCFFPTFPNIFAKKFPCRSSRGNSATPKRTYLACSTATRTRGFPVISTVCD